MKIKELRQIEANIDACIDAYDEAIVNKDHEIAINAIKVMQYELDKLDKNEIELRTYKQ